MDKDPNVDEESDLVGVVIKGGIQQTEYFVFGTWNSNGTEADPVPEGAPEISHPPAVGIVSGSEINTTYDYDEIFF